MLVRSEQGINYSVQVRDPEVFDQDFPDYRDDVFFIPAFNFVSGLEPLTGYLFGLGVDVRADF